MIRYPASREGVSTEFVLHLFGGPRLDRHGVPVALSPQELLFVALVGAFHEEGISRDEVLDYLWPKGDQNTLRSRFRQLLHMVRTKLGNPDAIVRRQRRLFLNRLVVSSDLTSFYRHLEASDFGPAIALLERDFLPGLQGSDSHTLVHWLERARVEFKAVLRGSLAAAVTKAEDQADFHAVADLGTLQLDLDPDDEVALRRVLKGYGSMGRASEAQAVYFQYRDRRRLWDPTWEPGPETAALFQTSTTISLDAPWARAFLKRTYTVDNTLHGRDGQRRVLRELLSQPWAESNRLVIVSGGPGMGQSRFLAEALREVVLEGQTVLFGVCGGRMQGRSLQAFFEVMAHPRVQEALSGLPLALQDVLVSTIGSRAHAHEGTEEAFPFPSVCEAVAVLLRDLSAKAPIILAIDDYHLSDINTRLLISYLATRLPSSPVKILIAVGMSNPVSKQDNILPHWPIHTFSPSVIELAPLPEDSLQGIGRELLGESCPEDLLHTITTLSNGSPKKLVDLCHAVRESCPLPLWNPALAMETVASYASRGMALSQLRLLAILSVAQAPLPVRCLASALEMEQGNLDPTLQKLAGEGWLALSVNSVSLSAEHLGKALLSTVPDREIRHYHARLSESLASLDDYGRTHQVAFHLVRSGSFESAVPWVEKALKELEDHTSSSVAADLAMELLSHPLPAFQRFRLSGALGDHLLRKGDARSAAVYLATARDLGELVPAERASLLGLEVASIEADSSEPERDEEELLKRLEALRERLLSEGLWGLLARLTRIHLRVLDSGDNPTQEARLMTWLEDVAGIYEPNNVSDAHQVMMALCTRLSQGISPRGIRTLEVLTKFYADTGNVDGSIRCRNLGLVVSYHQGTLNTDEGLKARRRFLAAAEGLPDPVLSCRYHINMAVWYLDTGDCDGAIVALDQARQLVSGFCPAQVARELSFNRAELLLTLGHPEEALPIFLDGLSNSPVSPPDAGALLFAAGVAACHLRLGKRSEAQRIAPRPNLAAARWAFDNSLIWAVQGELLDRKEGAQFWAAARDQAARIKDVSPLWHMKAQLALAKIGRRWGMPPNPVEIADLVADCDRLRLTGLSSKLRRL